MLRISNKSPKVVWLCSLKALMKKALSFRSVILISVVTLTTRVPKMCYHPGLTHLCLSPGLKGGWGEAAVPPPWECRGSLTTAGISEESSGLAAGHRAGRPEHRDAGSHAANLRHLLSALGMLTRKKQTEVW